MSEMLDKTGPAPETRSVRFVLLLFGASAAPVFWLGQLMLAYAVTAHACFPGRYPNLLASTSSLNAAMTVFDLVAVIGAVTGGGVAFWCWRGAEQASGPRQKRVRFLALWGIFSSLCFLCAILFNVIGSLTVRPCLI